MRTAATPSTALERAPKLRLLPQRGKSVERSDSAARPPLRGMREAPDDQPVLLAGGDASTCIAMQRDLARTMPSSTQFVVAGELCELLVRAADARMVILSGEIEDVPAESLMQMLAHRHPSLAVVSLDSPVLLDDAVGIV